MDTVRATSVHVQVVCKLFWKFIILNDHNTGLTGLGLAKSKLSALEALDFSRHLASCARTLSMAPLSGAEADAIRSFFSSPTRAADRRRGR